MASAAAMLPPVTEALSLLDVSFVNNEWSVKGMLREPLAERSTVSTSSRVYAGMGHQRRLGGACRYWWTT